MEIWVAATDPRLSLPAIDGSTIRDIAAAPRIVIVKLQTDLAGLLAATLWRIDRPVRGNNSGGKAALLPIVMERVESTTEWEPPLLGTAPEEAQASEIGPAWVVQTESGAETFRAQVEGIGMHSAAVPEDTTARGLARAVTVAPPVWAREVEDPAAVSVEAVDGAVVAAAAGNVPKGNRGANMKPTSAKNSDTLLGITSLVLVASTLIVFGAEHSAVKKAQPAKVVVTQSPRGFDTPQQGADALIEAAGKFDEGTLAEIFGPGGEDIAFTGEVAQDRKHAADFAAEAAEKKSVSVDPKSGNRAFVLVGNEDWPFPVPLVKKDGKWFFDATIGRQELLYRRIGANELDAIQVCNGYVEAQYDYAFEPRKGYDVNQYAQRIVSTPGTEDGLAWQTSDGAWAGPIGEKIARAIEQGYTSSADPYHGYFFKILKGQGPAAPLGQIDYVVKGVMIGGFALVAAPAEYGVTGVKTFIVSQDGVVYQKDFGSKTLDVFKSMELFNPDNSWTAVSDESE